jgi:hypothetical protein
LAADAQEALARCIPARVAGRARDVLSNALAKLDYVECDATWAHGDFKLTNLVAASDNLIGIDLQLVHRGPVVFDVASFLNDFAVSARIPGMLRLLNRERRLERAFLDHYGMCERSIAKMALHFVRLCALAETWATETSLGGAFKRTALRMAYASVASRLVEELDGECRVARQFIER